MKKHVYGKLGMTRSDFGRVATSTTPDGIWGHRHNPLDGSITPDQWTTTVAWGFHSHAPAGAVSSTAEDVARFIAANLPQSGKPKLGVSDIELIRAQEQPDPAESTFSRAGWSV